MSAHRWWYGVCLIKVVGILREHDGKTLVGRDVGMRTNKFDGSNGIKQYPRTYVALCTLYLISLGYCRTRLYSFTRANGPVGEL